MLGAPTVDISVPSLDGYSCNFMTYSVAVSVSLFHMGVRLSQIFAKVANTHLNIQFVFDLVRSLFDSFSTTLFIFNSVAKLVYLYLVRFQKSTICTSLPITISETVESATRNCLENCSRTSRNNTEIRSRVSSKV